MENARDVDVVASAATIYEARAFNEYCDGLGHAAGHEMPERLLELELLVVEIDDVGVAGFEFSAAAACSV